MPAPTIASQVASRIAPRIVTATALFDGHDATINIIRRMLQDAGAEVIHLGHNRAVQDIVEAALQESANGICVSSYQGGHMEFFKYMKDLLRQAHADHIQIFGGGGGVILPEEKLELEKYGITQIFHPEDGRRLGLEGMIQMIMQSCDFNVLDFNKFDFSGLDTELSPTSSRALGMSITAMEQGLPPPFPPPSLSPTNKTQSPPLVLGITGTGGAGKSSLIDELTQRFLNFFPKKKIALVCVDPTKRKTGGSLLGDRIRINSLSRGRVFMRSLASRDSGNEIASALPEVIQFLKLQDFDFIIAETSGIGQGNMAITKISDISLYVMTSEFGAQSQLEKIDMLDFADFVAINKADHRGSQDALRDVSKQVQRSRKKFDQAVPVFLTQAGQFNDPGVNELFFALVDHLATRDPRFAITKQDRLHQPSSSEHSIVPTERQNYLADIAQSLFKYRKKTEKLADAASKMGALVKTQEMIRNVDSKDQNSDQISAQTSQTLQHLYNEYRKLFSEEEWNLLSTWQEQQNTFKQTDFEYEVRGKKIKLPLNTTTLSGTPIPKIALPSLEDWGDRWRFLRFENIPGEFPYTAGVFPLKRTDEDPKRMFAGEGPASRTNRRFHFLCEGEKSHRLSTAFDSVTLYGHDPDLRPDIFGKIGESGVSIATLNDMKTLYQGFDLCSSNTSVSMTINGPAPMMLAFFFNSAIDQQVSHFEKQHQRPPNEVEKKFISMATLSQVRGTVQADILKEDQGQNTCIFSIKFALKLMGDIQEYFIKQKIRNFYSVSISGYHIAEAGANPITQLAFTLANGFTYVEYYLNRGFHIDDFAPNLSFFFSNGLDAEYTVLGRVARRIWAIAIRDIYGGNERSQKLKYHIQTSGRSLHAQEIDFNDVRTTLQALLAISDNCNSLHTNAYDEAITTPTQESVRRAMAIQLILNKEFGFSKNENPWQGSYFVELLTDLVEDRVLKEFLRISERGGVLGAMETQYQRSKIQDESLHYEHLKHKGTLPIIGVNTFLDPLKMKESYSAPKIELARSNTDEKKSCLHGLEAFKEQNRTAATLALENLKSVALSGGNIFECLMSACRVCSLQQMTEALFEVGGQYRRNI